MKSNKLLEITDSLLKLNLKVKIVPPLSKWIEGDLQANQIKQIKIHRNPSLRSDVVRRLKQFFNISQTCGFRPTP